MMRRGPRRHVISITCNGHLDDRGRVGALHLYSGAVGCPWLLCFLRRLGERVLKCSARLRCCADGGLGCSPSKAGLAWQALLGASCARHFLVAACLCAGAVLARNGRAPSDRRQASGHGFHGVLGLVVGAVVSLEQVSVEEACQIHYSISSIALQGLGRGRATCRRAKPSWQSPQR
jgi:hypothetical protein